MAMNMLGIIYIPFMQYFDTSIVIRAAESLAPLTYAVVIGIGTAQGIIIGEAVVERFPRLTFHARVASIALFILFATNAVANILRFISPRKIHTPPLLNGSEGLAAISRFIDLSNPTTLLTFSMSILVFALLSVLRIRDYRRSFLLIISIVMAFITSALIFSDYRPSEFEVLLYALYQAGIVGGVALGTRRQLSNREIRFRYLRERWMGSSE
ncbi:MAG: hypothetical protein RMJ59_02800 [Candidatus Nitrosocaldus sp.]|nr:hypothetical protein [Candidatus Nitrosocaldus sp.]MCS7141438.1 hypothetical protein [Candidatus Nitrosocaldus sp.]MDW7999644.1 hypothetical protein [Candidatus Nitrosocaldus sp.]MDW8275298.1 hypothetical protein [Candidatus Nitrosocaldus sp.]